MQGRKIVVDQKPDRPKTGEIRPLKLDPRIPEIGNGDLSPRLCDPEARPQHHQHRPKGRAVAPEANA